jgi:hypothetical protein
LFERQPFCFRKFSICAGNSWLQSNSKIPSAKWRRQIRVIRHYRVRQIPASRRHGRRDRSQQTRRRTGWGYTRTGPRIPCVPYAWRLPATRRRMPARIRPWFRSARETVITCNPVSAAMPCKGELLMKLHPTSTLHQEILGITTVRLNSSQPRDQPCEYDVKLLS